MYTQWWLLHVPLYMYIHTAGLQEVRVSTVDEAMLLLRLGLQHRHVAHTKLNYNSSRSHSIYTIKLIRLVNMDKPSRALVNRYANE